MRRVLSYYSIAAIIVAAWLFVRPQVRATQTGLECSPQPYPITFNWNTGDDQMDAALAQFTDYLDRQFEEVYLRLCPYLDSLKDSLAFVDTTTADDTLPDTDEGCVEYADEWRPCINFIQFDADKFIWVDDTGGANGDAVGDYVKFKFGRTGGIEWAWKQSAADREYQWHDFAPAGQYSWTLNSGHGQLVWSGSGNTKTADWDLYDGRFTQAGLVKLAGSSPQYICFDKEYLAGATPQPLTQAANVYGDTFPATDEWYHSVRCKLTAGSGPGSDSCLIVYFDASDSGWVFWQVSGWAANTAD